MGRTWSMLMARDYYGDGYALADALRLEGQGEWASRLVDAIEGGFSSLEILMALRWHLEQLLAADGVLRTETRAVAAELHEAIAAALAL